MPTPSPHVQSISYINDLPNNVCSSASLFADDCVIYREFTNDSDISLLQSDANSISEWCSLWCMKLNMAKCKYMRVSRLNSTRPVYSIDNVPLEYVPSYKYLGVHITYDLSWKAHIEHIANNANRMLGYLKRNFFLAPMSLKLILCKTLVRSKLGYAASIWDPGLESLISESVQNRASRFILSNYHRTASVTVMKTSLSLPNLSIRTKVSRLCLFHEIYHHNSSLKQRLLTQPHYLSARNDHRFKVGIPSCRTNAYHHSFIPSTFL